MSKRFIITMTVPDGADTQQLAEDLDSTFADVEGAPTDATVWEWDDFWADYSDGVVTPADDSTVRIDRHRGGTT